MNKKMAVMLIAVGSVLVAFRITWDVLSAVGVITSDFNGTPIMLIGFAGLFCGIFAAIQANRKAAKEKKDSDNKEQ